LKIHFEKKKLTPAYALVVEKSGPKFKEDTGDAASEVQLGRGHIAFKKARLTALAAQLTRQLGRQVVDRTNLKGEYEFVLDWTPEAGESSAIPGQPGPPLEINSAGDELKPTIFTALQEQLGLRLRATKAPLDVLIIDHVEKPTEN
jgi:bla regulator protein blaR1